MRFETAIKTARKIVSNDNQKGNLATALLLEMRAEIEKGNSLDIIWADIALDMGVADKEQKIKGEKINSTLGTYRAWHRRAIKLFEDRAELITVFGMEWAEFKKEIVKSEKYDAQLDQSNGTETETEQTETETTGDEVQLTSIIVPRGIAEIMHRYERLRVVNPAEAARFEADMNAAAAKWN